MLWIPITLLAAAGADLALYVPKAIAHCYAVNWWCNFCAIFICSAADWSGDNRLRCSARLWNACDGLAVLGLCGGRQLLPNLRHHVRRCPCFSNAILPSASHSKKLKNLLAAGFGLLFLGEGVSLPSAGGNLQSVFWVLSSSRTRRRRLVRKGRACSIKPRHWVCLAPFCLAHALCFIVAQPCIFPPLISSPEPA